MWWVHISAWLLWLTNDNLVPGLWRILLGSPLQDIGQSDRDRKSSGFAQVDNAASLLSQKSWLAKTPNDCTEHAMVHKGFGRGKKGESLISLSSVLPQREWRKHHVNLVIQSSVGIKCLAFLLGRVPLLVHPQFRQTQRVSALAHDPETTPASPCTGSGRYAALPGVPPPSTGPRAG